MYKSKILAILILAFTAGSVKAVTILMTRQNESQSKEQQAVSGEPSEVTNLSRESYRKFLDSINLLESQIEKISAVKDRVSYLHRRLNEIEEERKKLAYSAVNDEISMDLILGTLREIPPVENFHLEDCDDYQTNVFVGFDPTSGVYKEPREPSVKRAFRIFKKICK